MSAHPNTSLGARMKDYEQRCRTRLPRRMPLIIRVDGRAFRTFTRPLKKPFDEKLVNAMNRCAMALCQEIHGAQMAYVQSDEISVLVHNYKRHETAAWFDNQVQKMVSVAASVAAASMTLGSRDLFGTPRAAAFDARAFILPENEVCNYFIWRQQDWIRNSRQMNARSVMSHRECAGKTQHSLMAEARTRGADWNALPVHLRMGRCIVKDELVTLRRKWTVDNELPTFSRFREYIEKHLAVEEPAPCSAPSKLYP